MTIEELEEKEYAIGQIINVTYNTKIYKAKIEHITENYDLVVRIDKEAMQETSLSAEEVEYLFPGALTSLNVNVSKHFAIIPGIERTIADVQKDYFEYVDDENVEIMETTEKEPSHVSCQIDDSDSFSTLKNKLEDVNSTEKIFKKLSFVTQHDIRQIIKNCVKSSYYSNILEKFSKNQINTDDVMSLFFPKPEYKWYRKTPQQKKIENIVRRLLNNKEILDIYKETKREYEEQKKDQQEI